ncbi:HNH endonuclease domain-containing protein [Streptomyces scabiei]|uniref:HNH endonuclease n=1 Tax=Streptomyces scabiei TaxID=1930 RepID=UPI0029A947AB|nr:HNH endonuclease domain-containing protein [Streptomyces scabiei]
MRSPRCAYCAGPAIGVDHVWPRSRGGDDHPNNLVPACRSCNSSKSNRSLLDDTCPTCHQVRQPGDVDTARQVAFYICRCGTAWHCAWNLQSVPSLLSMC